MSSNEHESFEQELKQIRPAQPPVEFLARLVKARLAETTSPSRGAIAASGVSQFVSWLLSARRWLVPAGGVAAVAAVILAWQGGETIHEASSVPTEVPAVPVLRADDVEIDREWIVDIDAVANLPTGEPVRVRYRQWIDELILRDTSRGIEIQQRVPRSEIIPVRFETY